MAHYVLVFKNNFTVDEKGYCAVFLAHNSLEDIKEKTTQDNYGKMKFLNFMLSAFGKKDDDVVTVTCKSCSIKKQKVLLLLFPP